LIIFEFLFPFSKRISNFDTKQKGMARSFESFRLQVVDKPFYRNDGFSTSKTAHVTIFNKEGKLLEEQVYGLPKLDEIYDLIGEGKEINLDNCFVQGFSLTACRRYLIQDKIAEIDINGFSAQNAFFHSPYEIDFSYSRLTGESFNLKGSTFVSSGLVFTSSKFICREATFYDAYFKVDRFMFNLIEIESEEITFKNCLFFNGVKDFVDTDFGNGVVSFINTDFGGGDVSFVNTRFNDSEVSFKVSSFGGGKADFRFAKFGKKAVSFDQTDFGEGKIDFRNVEFGKGRTSFNRCVFSNGEVSFDGAEVNDGKVTFLKSHFGANLVSFELFQGFNSDLIFDKVIFPGNVSFLNGIFKNLILTSCQFNGTVNLHVEKAEEINLSGCIARDIVDFYSHGEAPKLDRLKLTGFRLLGKLYVQWDANNLKSLVYSQTDSDWSDKSDQFRVLKQNFSDLGRYDDEDKAYVELMRCRQRHLLGEDIKGTFFSKLIAYPKMFFKLLIFDWMGLYATSPARVIVSILFVQVFFSFLFSFFSLLGLGEVYTGMEDQPMLFFRSLYMCVITFFTVGYGEFVPTGYSRILSGLVGFMGVFLMSYFTVAFVRKILR